jgi:ferredoxin
MTGPSRVFILLCILIQLHLSYFSIFAFSPLSHSTKSCNLQQLLHYPSIAKIFPFYPSFHGVAEVANILRRETHLLDTKKNYLSLESKEASENKGFGGYWPGDPNAKKYNVTIQLSSSSPETISLLVPEDRYIYFYFEEMGFPLPFVNAQRMCRQGCCTICTARVLNSQPLKEEGEFSNKAKVKMDSPLGIYYILFHLCRFPHLSL